MHASHMIGRPGQVGILCVFVVVANVRTLVVHPTCGCRSATEKFAKAPPEVVGQEGVQEGVDTRVHVRQAVGGHLEANERHLDDRVHAELLKNQNDLDGQPAHSEDDDHDDHHAGDSLLGANALLGLVASRDHTVEEPLQHEPVQATDNTERHRVAEGQEAGVEDFALLGVVEVGQVDAGGAILLDVLVVEDAVLQQERHVTQEDDDPGDGHGQPRVPFGADAHGADGVHHGQVAVQGHQHQGVDAGVGTHVGHVLHHFAPHVPERPHGHGVGGGREGHAKDDEQQVGYSQRQNEDVGGVPHVLV